MNEERPPVFRGDTLRALTNETIRMVSSVSAFRRDSRALPPLPRVIELPPPVPSFFFSSLFPTFHAFIIKYNHKHHNNLNPQPQTFKYSQNAYGIPLPPNHMSQLTATIMLPMASNCYFSPAPPDHHPPKAQTRTASFSNPNRHPAISLTSPVESVDVPAPRTRW